MPASSVLAPSPPTSAACPSQPHPAPHHAWCQLKALLTQASFWQSLKTIFLHAIECQKSLTFPPPGPTPVSRSPADHYTPAPGLGLLLPQVPMPAVCPLWVHMHPCGAHRALCCTQAFFATHSHPVHTKASRSLVVGHPPAGRGGLAVRVLQGSSCTCTHNPTGGKSRWRLHRTAHSRTLFSRLVSHLRRRHCLPSLDSPLTPTLSSRCRPCKPLPWLPPMPARWWISHVWT